MRDLNSNFKPGAGGKVVALVGQAPALGQGHQQSVSQHFRMAGDAAPAVAPPNGNFAPAQNPSLGGAQRIPTKQDLQPGTRNNRDFSPGQQHAVPIRGMGQAAPPALNPIPAAHPSLAGAQTPSDDDIYLSEIEGVAPNGQKFVARYEAQFPRGSKILGAKLTPL